MLFFVVNSYIRKQIVHGGISKIFFLDDFSPSFLGQKLCNGVDFFMLSLHLKNIQGISMKQKCYKRNPIQMFGHNSVLSLDSFPAFLNDPSNPNKMFYVLPKRIFEIILKSTWISRPDTIGFLWTKSQKYFYVFA